MKIVIDIPDEEYKRLAYIDISKLREYIENGTPLSEGCERLISANEFKKVYTTTKMNEGIHRIIYEKIIDGEKTTIEGWIFDRKVGNEK